jgi:hypothetical protein
VAEDEQFRRAKFQSDFFGVAGMIDPSEDQHASGDESGSQSIERLANAEPACHSDQAIAIHVFSPR